MNRGRWLAAVAAGCVILVPVRADNPKVPADSREFDKLVVATLREVHNKGADLYNTAQDYPGAFRFYQGALATTRLLLAHRPEAQKLIDDGLAAAEKETDVALKAYKLHETIEAVRTHLKAAIAKAPEPKKVVEPPKKPEVKPMKPEPQKKPAEIAPTPRLKKA